MMNEARGLGQMMAVTLRQLSASTSSIVIWGSVWRFPSIIEISVRKFKTRLISEILVILSEHQIIRSVKNSHIEILQILDPN
jgi:hypothetical protein